MVLKVFWNEVNLPKMKGGHLLITAAKKEILMHYNGLCVIDASGQEKGNSFTTDKYCPSGIVVLCICKLQRQKNMAGLEWSKEHANMARKSKTNIMSIKASHFGSNGYYDSLGNKGNFRIANDSSITQYENKKYKSAVSTNKALFNAHIMEGYVQGRLNMGLMD